MFICPECESSVGDDDIICVSCGADLQKNSKVDSACALQNSVIRSDCAEFKCEWNQGSSIFIADTTSSLSFRFTPVLPSADSATKFQLFLKFPGDSSFTEYPLRFARLPAPREVYVNYRPSVNNIGSDQAVDFYFSYELSGEKVCFAQQIKIDVYAQNISRNKVLENLNISIGDIKQEGYGGDPSLDFNLLKDIYHRGSSLNELLDSLKKSDLWSEMMLFRAIPITAEKESRQIVTSHSPVHTNAKLTLFTEHGMRIHLLSGDVTMGRRRDADIVIRKLPVPYGESHWDHQHMVEKNCRISGRHCKIGCDSESAWVYDLSINGTFINSRKIASDKITLPLQKKFELAMGAPPSSDDSITLNVMVYKTAFSCLEEYASLLMPPFTSDSSENDIIAGIVMTRTDDVPESYMIINRCLPLYLLDDRVSEEWMIREESGAFALLGKSGCTLLEPGVALPTDSGFTEVTELRQYYMND